MHASINRNFLATCFILLISFTPAQAIEINDEGAKRLKSMLIERITTYKKSITQSEGELVTDGEITIEQGNDYYAATIPAMTFKTVTGKNIKIGLIAINATPTDNPDDWKMSVALPTPILITDKNGKTTERLDIGTQNMGGLWSSQLESFSKISAQYNNVKFTNIEKNDGLDIGKIVIKSDLEKNKKNLWGGESNIAISNFSASSPTIKDIFSIQEIMTSINIDGYNPKKQKQATEKLQTSNGADTGRILMDILKTSGNVSAQFNFKNLKISDLNTKNNVSGIDLIQFEYSSTPPQDNKVNQGFSFGYNGLQLKKEETISRLIPEQFKTSLFLENFPLMEVMNFAEDTIDENKDSTARQVAATKAMNFLPQKLKDAGTILMLKKTNFGNDLYSVKIDGEIKAEPSSQLGGIGNLNIETTGMNAIMNELEKSKKGKSMAQQLTIFRVISDEEGDKNSARIQLNETGNITVNNKDMSALIGGNDASSEGQPAQ